jgi:hypothetical protein
MIICSPNVRKSAHKLLECISEFSKEGEKEEKNNRE